MSPPTSPSSIVEHFRKAHPSIDLVRLLFTDFGNITRGRNITISRLSSIANDPELHSGLRTAAPVSHLFTPPGGDAHFEVIDVAGDNWVPQWDTLRPYGVDPKLGLLICSLHRNSSADPLECDPRTILQRNVDRAKSLGLEYRVGIEVEFTIMPSAQLLKGFDEPSGYLSPATYGRSWWKSVEEMVRHAEKAGIPVWSFETEGGPGSCEISTAPQDPVSSVDSLIILREIIYGAASKAGLHATLYPIPFDGAGSCGLHTHISVQPSGNGDHVLAGIIDHAPALSGILLGGYDSATKRLFSIGAGDLGWGYGKHAAVNRLKEGHLELRTPDALTNPYLQLASIIGVATKACEDKTPLKMKPLPLIKAGQPIPEDMRADLGLKHSLEPELMGRVQALKDDAEVFGAILGKTVLESYIWYREQEIAKSSGMQLDERRRKAIPRL